jgi:hypothetical protein
VRTAASDIQGFVERKQNVFNFYLLDNQMILPEPQDLPDDDDDIHATTTSTQNVSPSATSGVIHSWCQQQQQLPIHP